jgi:hypothetical protein
MTVSMYSFSVPILSHALRNLDWYLETAIKYAADNGIDEKELFDARLFHDMLPLSAQVQRASDTAKASMARLTGLPVPSFPDEEKTLSDLRTRLAKTVELLETFTPESLAGSEEREVKLPFLDVPLSGYVYAAHFMIPNFFFHVTTVHDILRNRGLPVGKRNFLGKVESING